MRAMIDASAQSLYMLGYKCLNVYISCAQDPDFQDLCLILNPDLEDSCMRKALLHIVRDSL